MNKEQLDLIKVISRGVSDGIVIATQKLESSTSQKMTVKDHVNVLRSHCEDQITCEECSFHTDNTPCRINFPYLWKLKEIE